MHWYNYVALVAAPLACISSLFQRRWIMAAAFACIAAYQVFGKLMPTVLPAPLPDAFSLVGFGLFVLEIVRSRRRRTPAQAVR